MPVTIGYNAFSMNGTLGKISEWYVSRRVLMLNVEIFPEKGKWMDRIVKGIGFLLFNSQISHEINKMTGDVMF